MKLAHLTLAALLALTPLARSQTALVVPLTASEAQTASSLYAQRDAINAKIDEFHITIKNKYAQSYSWGDFEFSVDFKFIVPKIYPVSPICSYPIQCGSFGNMVVPTVTHQPL